MFVHSVGPPGDRNVRTYIDRGHVEFNRWGKLTLAPITSITWGEHERTPHVILSQCSGCVQHL